jgi:hypothetical protein
VSSLNQAVKAEASKPAAPVIKVKLKKRKVDAAAAPAKRQALPAKAPAPAPAPAAVGGLGGLLNYGSSSEGES